MKLIASTGVKLKVTNQGTGVGHGLLCGLAAVALLKLHQLVCLFGHFA